MGVCNVVGHANTAWHFGVIRNRYVQPAFTVIALEVKPSPAFFFIFMKWLLFCLFATKLCAEVRDNS
jgi:hypothetical protein